MTPPLFRAAVYYAPAVDDPLWEAGNAWLGRDPELNRDVAQPYPSMRGVTAAPLVYGFHATLRPPMQLATGWPEFLGAVERIAAEHAAFSLPPLRIMALDGFLALGLSAPCPPMDSLAEQSVRQTDRHRLPADAAELARRRAAGLTAEEEALLLTWGYPYVLQRWQFHMTLSGRLAPPDMAIWQARATAHFEHVLGLPRRADALSVFTQASRGAALLVAERMPLSVR